MTEVWYNTVTTGSTTTLPVSWNGSYTNAVFAQVPAYPPPGPAPAQKPPGPLEWLDAEVERTCALARAA